MEWLNETIESVGFVPIIIFIAVLVLIVYSTISSGKSKGQQRQSSPQQTQVPMQQSQIQQIPTQQQTSVQNNQQMPMF